MTVHHPDETKTDWLARWGKTLIAVVLSASTTWGAMQVRVAVLQQQAVGSAEKFSEIDGKFTAQENAIQHLRDTKVEKDTYDGDQKRIAEELSAIQLSVGRIEEILMGQKGR